MKKLLIVAGILTVGMSVLTDSVNADAFSGPAVGLSVGVGSTSYKINKGVYGDTAFGTVAKASNTGFNGRVFGQWGSLRRSMYYGVDLGVGFDTSKAKKSISGATQDLGFTSLSALGINGLAAGNTVTITDTLRNNFFVSPGIRFGGIVGGRTLFFGRVGVNVQFQRLDTTVATPAGSAIFKDNMVTTQIAPGLGVDYMLSNKVFVRGQVEYAIGIFTSGNRSHFRRKPSAVIANIGFGAQF